MCTRSKRQASPRPADLSYRDGPILAATPRRTAAIVVLISGSDVLPATSATPTTLAPLLTSVPNAEAQYFGQNKACAFPGERLTLCPNLCPLPLAL